MRALLRFEPESGFALLALDGEAVYQVVDDKGAQVRFRTVEDALGRLNDVHGLSPDIGLFLAGRSDRLTLEQMLKLFDPTKHGGEVMADAPVGREGI